MPFVSQTFPRIHINAFTTPDIYQLESPQTSYLHIFVLSKDSSISWKNSFTKLSAFFFAHAMPFSQSVNQVLYVQFRS